MKDFKAYKPTTPGRRNRLDINTRAMPVKPEKKLLTILPKHSGRNNQGRVTVRHQGGRQKRFLRKIDFKREKHDIPARVVLIEYDPNRSANIALVYYKDG